MHFAWTEGNKIESNPFIGGENAETETKLSELSDQ